MRACELMPGRTDVESALLARGAVAMTLLSIVIVGAKCAMIAIELGVRIVVREW